MPLSPWTEQYFRARFASATQLLDLRNRLQVALLAGEEQQAAETLKVLEPSFRLRGGRVKGQLELDYPSRDLAHVALFLLEGVPEEVVTAGLRARPLEQSLAELEAELAVSIPPLRVRVGVSRGHLLEVAISIPLDLNLPLSELDYLAGEIVSRTLGDRFCDVWVAHVDVVQAPRAKGLLMVRDSVEAGTTHPLVELPSLLRRGTRLILEQLESKSPRNFTALNIPPAEESGLQAERCYASTADPEALKAVLEGLPHASQRFRRDGALFFFLSYVDTGRATERLERQTALEAAVSEVLGEHFVLSGTGFSPQEQYIDFFLREPEASLRRLFTFLQEQGREFGPSSFCIGHYDEDYRSASYVVESA